MAIKNMGSKLKKKLVLKNNDFRLRTFWSWQGCRPPLPEEVVGAEVISEVVLDH